MAHIIGLKTHGSQLMRNFQILLGNIVNIFYRADEIEKCVDKELGPTYYFSIFSINDPLIQAIMPCVLSISSKSLEPYAQGKGNVTALNSHRFIMGEFENGKMLKVVLSFVTLGFIVNCVYGFYGAITDILPEDTHWIVWACIGLAFLAYFLFILYLSFYMIIVLGFESLTAYKWVQKFYDVQEYLDEKTIPQQENSNKSNGIKL